MAEQPVNQGDESDVLSPSPSSISSEPALRTRVLQFLGAIVGIGVYWIVFGCGDSVVNRSPVIDSLLFGLVGGTLASPRLWRRKETGLGASSTIVTEGEQPLRTGMKFFGWLSDTSGRPLLYVLKVWPVDTIPSIILAIASMFLIWGVTRDLGSVDLKKRTEVPSLPLALIKEVGIDGPAVETILMIPVLWLLRLLIRRSIVQALVSALVWGLLHSAATLHAGANPLAAALYGLVMCWGFFILSTAFLAWWKESVWPAFAITWSIHALNNLTAALLLVMWRALHSG